MPGSDPMTTPRKSECAARAGAENPQPTGCSTTPQLESRLGDLISVVVVLVSGCENCAEAVVVRALEHGCSTDDLGLVLRIVARMRGIECIADAFGPEAIARMDKPLAAARRVLQEPAARTGA